MYNLEYDFMNRPYYEDEFEFAFCHKDCRLAYIKYQTDTEDWWFCPTCKESWSIYYGV